MNNIKPKTEPTLSPKSEQPEDELATPLSSDETICQSTTNEEHQPAIEFNATNGFNQQPTCNSDGNNLFTLSNMRLLNKFNICTKLKFTLVTHL